MKSALFALALIAAPALAVPASDLLIRQTSPQISWRWRAAPEVGAQPALLRGLRAEAMRAAAKDRLAAGRDAAAAKKAGFPFRRHEVITDWSLAADTPHLLALSGLVYAFTGGAHGNTGYTAKIWDKAGQRAVTFEGLFSDWPHARRLLEPLFCKALAEEQARRQGAPPSGDWAKCPRLAEQPIVPWGDLATRAPQFRVLVGPYVAGPYSDGSYLITLPWPDAVKPLVKPAYRDDLFGGNE